MFKRKAAAALLTPEQEKDCLTQLAHTVATTIKRMHAEQEFKASLESRRDVVRSSLSEDTYFKSTSTEKRSSGTCFYPQRLAVLVCNQKCGSKIPRRAV